MYYTASAPFSAYQRRLIFMPRKSMRRPQGTGSVYKKNDTRRRKPWVAVVNYGLKENGVRSRHMIGSFATSREAWEALSLYFVNKEENGFDTAVTFGQLFDRLKKEKENTGGLSRQYMGAWKNHLSQLAKTPIANVKAMHLQDIIDNSGLAGGAQQRLATLLHWIYAIAISNDLISKDYSQFIKIVPKTKSDMHRPFSTEEMRILWKNTNEDFVKVILMMTYTGCRPTELATIKTESLHLSERYALGGMKTAAGINRIIPIAECVYPFFQYFSTAARFKRYPYIIIPDPASCLFARSGHLDLTKTFAKSLPQKLGILNHRGHDCRHTFVTMADNYGMNETTLKRIVGHSLGKDVTKDVYTHKTIQQLVSAVNSLPFGEAMNISPEEKFGSPMVAR